jgi:hypothetical protein
VAQAAVGGVFFTGDEDDLLKSAEICPAEPEFGGRTGD